MEKQLKLFENVVQHLSVINAIKFEQPLMELITLDFALTSQQPGSVPLI
jgi:hypothetical protein